MNLESFGRIMMAVALFLFLFGLVIFFIGRMGIPKLPGDIFIKRGNTSIAFPIMTSLVVSVILTIIINIIIYFLRR